MTKKRELSAEEAELWRVVTQHDTLFAPQSTATPPPPAPPAPAPAKAERDPAFTHALKALETRGMGMVPPPKPPPQPVRVTEANIPGIDGRTAERLRKGKLPIDATLDLHGMTQDAAFTALEGFVLRTQEQGKRMLLVITGKGRDAPNTPGVLKEAVPGWLDAPHLAPHILAWREARPEHGGGGALYLLLRRQRG